MRAKKIIWFIFYLSAYPAIYFFVRPSCPEVSLCSFFFIRPSAVCSFFLSVRLAVNFFVRQSTYGLYFFVRQLILCLSVRLSCSVFFVCVCVRPAVSFLFRPFVRKFIFCPSVCLAVNFFVRLSDSSKILSVRLVQQFAFSPSVWQFPSVIQVFSRFFFPFIAVLQFDFCRMSYNF